MPLRSLTLNDFSQRTPLTNLMEMAKLTELSQRQNERADRMYDFWRDQPVKEAERGLHNVRLGQQKKALEANPNMFNNQYSLQSKSAEEGLRALPFKTDADIARDKQTVTNIGDDNAMRPLKNLETRLTAYDNLTHLIDPQALLNPELISDEDVDSFYNALGIKIPGMEQQDTMQRRGNLSQILSEKRKVKEEESMRQAMQKAKFMQAITPPQLRGQPFPAVGPSGQPAMFQSTDRGVVPIPGLAPTPSSSNIKTTVRTMPDGSQQEVIFDNQGNEISAINKGTAKTQKNTLRPTDIAKISKLGVNAQLLNEAATAIEALPERDLGPIDARVNQVLGGSPAYNEALQKYNYVINQIRNELFGSALTATEQAAFEKMAATPTDFSEARFKQNTRGLANLVNEALNSRVKELEQTGYNVPESLQTDIPRRANDDIPTLSPEEAAKQPSGTTFRGNDGNTYIVP